MTLQRPIEVELKYRVHSLAAGERLLNRDTLGPLTAEGPARTTESEDRYVDTRDGALARAGYAARLRRERTTTTISLKSLALATGSLQRRTEIEGPAERTLAPADWPHSPARSMVLELAGDVPLVELVTVRQVRRKRPFVAGDTAVEVSLDEVEVIARAQHVDRFTELEIELVEGPEAPLLELRDILDREPGLSPSTVSKLDAALEAAKLTRPGRPIGVRQEHAPRRGDRAVGPRALPAGTNDVGREAPATVAPREASDRNGDSGVRREPRRDSGREEDGRPGPARASDEARSDATEAVEHRPASEPKAASSEPKATSSEPKAASSEPKAASSEPETGSASDQAQPTTGAERPPEEPRRERSAKRAAASAATAARTSAPAVPDPAAGLAVGKTPGVTAADVVAEAGRKVLRFHLARLIAREPGTRLGVDAEELHGMRVATRRMRAAWRVFGDGFRVDGTRRFRNRLRDVAAKLGAVRDIDVLIIALEEYRAGLPAEERQALEPLLDDWRAQREAGRVVMVRELDSDGYRQFVDDFRAFVLTPGAGALVVSPTDPHHVRDTAGSRIWHAYEVVLAYGPVLRWADVPTLHQLRIAGKWLRYTLEFVAEALGPEAKPLIEKVVALQDHLGLMNDAEVAAMKARALLVARSGTLSDAQTTAIARYLTSREREVARLKRGAAAPWRAVASPAFRRGLGRAVAAIAASPTGPAAG